MKSCLLVLFVLFVNCDAIGADSTHMKIDTTVRKMKKVDITADYIISKKNTSYAPISVVNSEQIASLGVWQVSDALMLLPSSYIKNYGGLNAQKTISLRATTSQQTLVLLDGIRIASSANGTVDLSSIPLINFNEIELSSGGSSALYGGGAMAGVVNLISNKSIHNRVSFSLFGGSFGDGIATAVSEFPFLGAQWNLGGELVHSDGDFPFTTNQFGKELTLKRENSDFQNLGLSLSSSFKLQAWKFINRLFIRTTKRGTPGAVLQGTIEQVSSRLNEDEVLLVHSCSRNLYDNSTLSFTTSARYSSLKFRDKDALFRGPNGADDLYVTRELMLSAKYETIQSEFRGIINLEWTYSDLQGNFFQPTIGNEVHRSNLSASSSIEKEWPLDSSIFLSSQLQTRCDLNFQNSNTFSPSLSFIVRKERFPLRLRGNFSYNFRLPSFNELYYFNYGTSDLRPERSSSFNLGGMWQIDSLLFFEVNGFVINTLDQIISVPKSPIVWSAQNIATVLSRGVELSVSSQFLQKQLLLQLSYTRQIAVDKTINSLTYKKIIPSIPQELFSASWIINILETSIGGTINYSSFRYLLGDNTPESIVPSYFQLNSFVEHTIKSSLITIALRAECNNVLNNSYSVVLNYPLPARSFRLGMRVKIDNQE